LAEISKRNSEFKKSDVDAVREQAKLIPAVAYPETVRNEVVNILTAFYLNPNNETFNALGVKYRTFVLTDGDRGKVTAEAFLKTVTALSVELAHKLVSR